MSFVFYESIYAPVALLRAIYKELTVLFVMFLGGAVVFANYDHLPPLGAFLASISTITTIGLYVPNGGNFVTLNRTEAVLLILTIIISVGTGASILQSTMSTVVNGSLARGEAEKRLIKMTKGQVIVFGYSHLGRYVAEKLETLGFDYVIVTKDPNTYQDLLKKNVMTVLEYETQPIEALKAAGIENAKTVIICHTNDPDNMLVTLSARKLRPEVRIITVVHDPALVETARNAGAYTVVPSFVTLGHLLALSTVTKDIVGVVFSEKMGKKEIAQFSVFDGSTLIARGLQEIFKLATVIGVVRNGELVQNVFDPNFRIMRDDTLLVLGDPGNLQTLEEEARAT